MQAGAFVTVEEAGKALGLSVATVWRRIRSGQLPSVRRNGRRLVPKRALSRRQAASSKMLPAFTEDHPMFRLAGAAHGGGRRPGARDKHAILDED
jgi:excisionase family DNA binding protein